MRCLIDTIILLSAALFPNSIQTQAYMKAVTAPHLAKDFLDSGITHPKMPTAAKIMQQDSNKISKKDIDYTGKA